MINVCVKRSTWSCVCVKRSTWSMCVKQSTWSNYDTVTQQAHCNILLIHHKNLLHDDCDQHDCDQHDCIRWSMWLWVTKIWYSNTTNSSRWLPLGRAIMSTLEHLEPLQTGHVGHTWDKRSEPCHVPVWGKGMDTVLSGRINVNGWETRLFRSRLMIS